MPDTHSQVIHNHGVVHIHIHNAIVPAGTSQPPRIIPPRARWLPQQLRALSPGPDPSYGHPTELITEQTLRSLVREYGIRLPALPGATLDASRAEELARPQSAAPIRESRAEASSHNAPSRVVQPAQRADEVPRAERGALRAAQDRSDRAPRQPTVRFAPGDEGEAPERPHVADEMRSTQNGRNTRVHAIKTRRGPSAHMADLAAAQHWIHPPKPPSTLKTSGSRGKPQFTQDARDWMSQYWVWMLGRAKRDGTTISMMECSKTIYKAATKAGLNMSSDRAFYAYRYLHRKDFQELEKIVLGKPFFEWKRGQVKGGGGGLRKGRAAVVDDEGDDDDDEANIAPVPQTVVQPSAPMQDEHTATAPRDLKLMTDEVKAMGEMLAFSRAQGYTNTFVWGYMCKKFHARSISMQDWERAYRAKQAAVDKRATECEQRQKARIVGG